MISKILLFKIGKNTILFIGDTLLLFVGYEHYLIGLYAILDIRRLFDGKSINAIETDCEKISNLFYALSTTILSPIEITILLWLLIQTTECTDTLFVLIGLLYLCLYSLGGFLTYRFNIQMLHEKDNRLNMSIIEATHDKLL